MTINNAYQIRRGLARCAILLLPLAILSGCVIGPKFHRPEVPTASEWRELGDSIFKAQPVEDAEWWKTLNDPVLNRLITEAHAGNLSLQAAALRIVHARLVRTGSIFVQFPFVMGEGSYTHVDMSTNVKPEVTIDKKGKSSKGKSQKESGRRLEQIIRGKLGSKAAGLGTAIADSMPAVSVTPELDIYDAHFDAVWEADIWGKHRQQIRAATHELDAAYAGYDDALIMLQAEVARMYVELRAHDRRIAVLTQIIGTYEEFSKTSAERITNKQAPASDNKLIEAQAGLLRTRLPDLQQNRRQLENALCLLLGKAPQDLSSELGASEAVPLPPLYTTVGAPADLLRRRPDVRQAEYLAAAECARLGLAKAKILPSFTLFGSIGVASSEYDSLFDTASEKGAYGAGASITNLINYPITVQFVRAKNVEFETALLNYREIVLQANAEVENAMHGYLMSRQKLKLLEGNADATRQAADMTVAQYRAGQGSLADALLGLSTLATAEDQLWDSRAVVTSDYVTIYKALGGGWENRTKRELISENVREEMKQQADWWSFTGKSDMKTIQAE